MDDETIHDLIGTIYEAPLDPRQWGLVANRLKGVTKSHHAHVGEVTVHDNVRAFLSSRDRYLAFENDKLTFSEIAAIAEGLQDPFVTHPGLLRHNQCPEGKAFLVREVLPLDELKRSPFYNEFGAKIGIFEMLMAFFICRAGVFHAISLMRSERDPLYDDNEVRLLNVFVPHIRRSLELHGRLRAANAQARVLQNSIDALTSAVVLLDRIGRVVFLNAAAEHLLKRHSELFVRWDRLCAKHHADAEKLHQLIKRVTNGEGRRPVGGAVTIQRAPLELPLQVVAAPVSIDVRTSVMTGLGPVAMLVIQDPSEETRVPEEIIAAMFSLTSAETRLLLALSNGQTLKQYADEAHLTQNTVRAYLKSVFAKTKTSRQSDLVRLMSGVTHSIALSEQ